jgi:hypothetical protein
MEIKIIQITNSRDQGIEPKGCLMTIIYGQWKGWNRQHVKKWLKIFILFCIQKQSQDRFITFIMKHS